MNIKNANFAIVHDWFLSKSLGGSEKVTFLIDKLLINNFSTPELFSLVSNIDFKEKNNLKKRKINTSFIQNLPYGNEYVQNYLPFLPFAVEQLDLSEYDFVISSSHAFAKGVITSPDQIHISYVHTPIRYAWDQMNVYLKQTKLTKFGLEIPLRYILYKLREWDFSSSQRIDYLISNSNFTANRIKKYWGRESEVINPPVDIKRFRFNKNRGDFYLSVNRLVPNKRIDILVKAFNNLKLPLIIIGDGPERLKLEKIANSNIIFIRNSSNSEVEDYMSRCKAFIYAGIEDFGIAPLEAMASGAPVIAFGKGGLLDTVNCLTKPIKNQVATGILFKKQTPKDVEDVVVWFEDNKIWKKFNSQDLNLYTHKYSKENFENNFKNFIEKSWDKFHKNKF